MYPNKLHHKASMLGAMVLALLMFTPWAAAQSPGASNEVPNLKLPSNQKVDHNTVAALRIRAETQAKKVKFLVVGSIPGLTSKQVDAHTLILDIPQKEATIFVYAIAWHNGDFTKFARTVVVVAGESSPDPPALPPVTKLPLLSHATAFTIVLERDKQVSDDIVAYVKSAKVQNWLKQGGHKFIVYWTDNPDHIASIQRRKLTKYVNEVKTPAYVVQLLKTGVLLDYHQAPATLEAFVARVNSLLDKAQK